MCRVGAVSVSCNKITNRRVLKCAAVGVVGAIALSILGANYLNLWQTALLAVGGEGLVALGMVVWYKSRAAGIPKIPSEDSSGVSIQICGLIEEVYADGKGRGWSDSVIAILLGKAMESESKEGYTPIARFARLVQDADTPYKRVLESHYGVLADIPLPKTREDLLLCDALVAHRQTGKEIDPLLLD